MKPQNPDYKEVIQAIFGKAHFIQGLGIAYVDCGPGWCETELTLETRHMQQDNIAHAGVQGTMADHTAGAAAGTLMSDEQLVLTVEYKLHLLRPAIGSKLFCRADVLKPGSRLTIVESSVYAVRGDAQKLAAKGMFTMALLPNDDDLR